jgi:hypothetical protein
MSKARDLANAGTALTTVSATELGFLDGVTSAIQTQVDAKIAKTVTTTTGDIIYASSANTPARLGIGSSAQVLTVAAGVPSWATPASSGFVGCSVSNVTNSSVSAANNTVTVIPFDTEAYDTDGFHSTATNTSRMTIPAGKGGKYICTGKFRWDTNTTGTRFITFVINGTDQDYNNLQPYAASPYSTHTAVFSLSAGDYIEIAAYQDSGGSRTVNLNSQQSKFTISYLGA